MTAAERTNILASLQAMHGEAQRRAAELDRYRALRAIEQTIADFPSLDDVTHSLGDLRDRVRQQLDGTREFRALRSIERILPELSEVMLLLDEQVDQDNPDIGDADPDLTANDQAACDQAAHDEASGDDGVLVLVQSSAETVAPAAAETVMVVGTAEQSQNMPASARHAGHDAAPEESEQALRDGLDDRPSLTSDAASPDLNVAPIPSLADSVAQLMAQAVVPPPRESHAPPAPPDWTGSMDAAAQPQTPAERAA